MQRKDLEAALGLLNWATSLSKHMRPFMAPLYKDLHSAKGTLHSIAPSMWSSFVDCLDSTAKLTRTPSGTWLPRHAQLFRSRQPQDQKQGRRTSCAAIAQAPVGTPCRPATVQKYICARKANSYLRGWASASHMNSLAPCAVHPGCTAIAPPMPLQTRTAWE